MVAIDPSRFFEPRFGGRDWVGVYLDVKIDWDEAHELLTEAYCTVAPSKLASLVR